jgi:hypothetical protein
MVVSRHFPFLAIATRKFRAFFLIITSSGKMPESVNGAGFAMLSGRDSSRGTHGYPSNFKVSRVFFKGKHRVEC